MTGRRAAIASVAVGAILVVAAWGVVQLEPSAETREASVPVRLAEGEWGSGRNIEGVVRQAVVAQRLTDGRESEPWNGATTGIWVVVRAETATIRRTGLVVAELDYAGLRVPASDRPPQGVQLDGTRLAPGIAASGWLAFEVPADAPMPDTATLRIAEGIDARLDTVLVSEVDLAGATRLAEFVLEPVTERVIP